jgi:hypothetical protein
LRRVYANSERVGRSVTVPPAVEAILVEEHEAHVNALCISVGEIGITGTAGAVAKAAWHENGIRVSNFPITLDRTSSVLSPHTFPPIITRIGVWISNFLEGASL